MSASQTPSIPNSESLGMLVDPAYERTLQNRVKELLAWRHDSFPGSRAVYFETAHLEYLKNEDYFVCEQNDGIRCLLFTTITPKGPATFVIDSKNSFRYLSAGLPVRDQPTFQHETLLDGELVVEKNGDKKLYRYLICDLIVLNKVLVAHKSFNNRLGMLNQEVILPFNRMISNDPTKRPPFKLELKKMERSYGLKVVLEHKNNGLLFTPVRSPYTCGLSRKLLKWKDPLSYTADLKIKVTYNVDRKPIYSVMATCNLNHKFLDHLQLEPSLFTDWRSSPPDGRIAEFRWDSQWPVTIFEKGYAPKTQKGGWRFVRFRDDKDTANEEEFAKLVRDGMPHAVTRDLLEKQVEEIRSNWKIREKSGVSGMQPPSGQSGGSHSQQGFHGSHERHSSVDMSNNLPRESPLPSPRHDQGFSRRRGSQDSSRKGSLDSVNQKSAQDEVVKKNSPSEPDLNSSDDTTTANLSKTHLEHAKPEKSPTKPSFIQTTEVPQIKAESKSPNDTHSDQPAIDPPSGQEAKSLESISPRPVHKAASLNSDNREKAQTNTEPAVTSTEIIHQDSKASSGKQSGLDSNVEATKTTPSESVQDWPSKLPSNSEITQSRDVDNNEEAIQTSNPGDREPKHSQSEETLPSQPESSSNVKSTESNALVVGDPNRQPVLNDKESSSLTTVQVDNSEGAPLPMKEKSSNVVSTTDVKDTSATTNACLPQSKGPSEVPENKHTESTNSNVSNGNSQLPEVPGNTIKRKSLGVEGQDEPQKHKKLSVESSPIQKEEQVKRQPQLHLDQQTQQSLPASLYRSQMIQPQPQPTMQAQQSQLFTDRSNQKRGSLSDSPQNFNRVEAVKVSQPPNQRLRSFSDTNAPHTYLGPNTLPVRDLTSKSDTNATSSHPGPGQVSIAVPTSAKAASYDARFHGTSPVLSKHPLTDTPAGSSPKSGYMNRRTSSGNETSLLDKLYGVEPLPTSQMGSAQTISQPLASPNVSRLTKSVTPGANQTTLTDQPQKFPSQFVSTQNHPGFQHGTHLKSNDNQIRRDSASNTAPFDRNNSIPGHTHPPVHNSQANPMQSAIDISHMTQQLGYSESKELRRGSPRYGAGYVSGDKQPIARHSISDIQQRPNHPKNVVTSDSREALCRSMTSPSVTGGLKNDAFGTSPILKNQQYGMPSADLHSVEARERDNTQRGYRPPIDVSVGPSQYAPMMDPNPQTQRNHSPSRPHHQNPLPGYPQGQTPTRSQTIPQTARPQIHPSRMHQGNPAGVSPQYHPQDAARRPPVHSMMPISTQYPMSASKSPGYRHAILQSPGTSVQNSPQIVPTRHENWQPMKDVGVPVGYPPPQVNPQWPGAQQPYHPSVPVYNSQSIHSTPPQPRSRPRSKGTLDFIMNSSEEEPDWRNTRL